MEDMLAEMEIAESLHAPTNRMPRIKGGLLEYSQQAAMQAHGYFFRAAGKSVITVIGWLTCCDTRSMRNLFRRVRRRRTELSASSIG